MKSSDESLKIKTKGSFPVGPQDYRSRKEVIL
nr:MAG TPA: hypothetical protein [Bacteriophage sp.]